MSGRAQLMLCAVVCAAISPVAVGARATPLFEIHYVMGTYLRIDADADDAAAARRAMRRCFADVKQAEERFTRFDPQSELSKLNADPATADALRVSDDMRALLEHAVDLRLRTAGDFDVTAGALTALWRKSERWPSAAAIDLARASSGPAALTVVDGRVRRFPGTIIDLDGIAKGWAVDQCAATLQQEGISAGVLSFGESSVRSFGHSRALSRHLTLRGLKERETVGEIAIADASISVSAVFGHEREIAGRRTGHIIDPQTGLPLQHAALAVAVANSATEAEAFSKALLIEAARGKRWRTPHIAGLRGGLVVTEKGIRRFGEVAFHPAAHRISPAAEPLR